MQSGHLSPFPPARRPALAETGNTRWQWRALAEHDLVWLPNLYASTREQELQAVPWPAQAKQQFLAQQFAAQHQHYLVHYPGAHYLALEQEGEVLGRFYIDESGKNDLLVDISLFPAWRGKGVGSELIQRQQQASASRGRSLSLHVMMHNVAAQRLYARLGFVVTAESADGMYLPMNWQPTAGASING